jgi:tetratricopeptide (TPR) repeat protein
MSDNYIEETTPLFKLLRTEAFRFVVVRYNHYSLVTQLAHDLNAKFPERSITRVDARKFDYSAISHAYFSMSHGFFFIENFDDVLKIQYDSRGRETPEYALQNERRRHITAGLNLRRDKLAKRPIALFIFVPATTTELYAKIIMEKMPDLWSFRSLILDLHKEIIMEKPIFTIDNNINTEPILNNTTEDPELTRLITTLAQTPADEIAYRSTLYPQIVHRAIDNGKYEQAFAMLEEWEKIAQNDDRLLILLHKGDILHIYGESEEALKYYEALQKIAIQKQDKQYVALTYERRGNIYTSLGNLDKALNYYEQYNQLEKELCIANPNEVILKNNLATSYEKLGNTHTSLSNLDKALAFFEKSNTIFKELYADYPQDASFKSNLSISYAKIGYIHAQLNNVGKFLMFIEQDNQLAKELHRDYPINVDFKNNLAVSYARLGVWYNNQQQYEQAKNYFIQAQQLWKELVVQSPNHQEFKNNLEKVNNALANLQNLQV